jgi:hypothetical protein
MTRPTHRKYFIAAIITSVMLAGCAADRLEHLSYWVSAKVLAVEPLESTPADVDRECIPPLSREQGQDLRLVIVLRYRVAKVPVTKAYLVPEGERWGVGDEAYVHPNTCQIRHGYSRVA